MLHHLPFDLHVLGLPLAFILSQDQTLHCNNPMIPISRDPVSSFHPLFRASKSPTQFLFVLNPYSNSRLKELQKHIAMSLVHQNNPLSSWFWRVRYQLSIIQRTFCLLSLSHDRFPATDDFLHSSNQTMFFHLPAVSLPEPGPFSKLFFRFGSAKVAHHFAFSKSSA